MAGPNAEFWQERFQKQQLPWDRGAASPQLAAWLASGALAAPARVAVPGCGSGWEVAELARRGFEVVGVDYAAEAVKFTEALLQSSGLKAQVVQADVLTWQPEQPLDAIYEQTCLCALHPDHWVAYAAALHRWLKPGGKLFALFMQQPRPEAAQGFVQGPPYHCDIHAMRALFDGARWEWPKPPYPQVPHPVFSAELAVCLVAK
ncbi:MAG: methyltransferase domain-containing protein [Candidatus Protistobacter heckmanni]|nr:methyltransferase domain-containing protein [Candidatus Protistobacter heckmanni]